MLQVSSLIGFGACPRQMLVDRTTGTNIGDCTANGGLAASFDGTTNQATAASSGKAVSAAGYNNTIGKTWDNAKIISKVVGYASNNSAINGGGGAALVKVQASNDGFASEVVDMYTTPGTVGLTGTTFTMEPATQRSFKSWRININGNGSNGIAVAEVEFWEER